MSSLSNLKEAEDRFFDAAMIIPSSRERNAS